MGWKLWWCSSFIIYQCCSYQKTTAGKIWCAAWWVPNRLWNRENNKTHVLWQGSAIRCNTGRDLHRRRSPSCSNFDSYFTLCGEKKPSLKNSRMHQLFTFSNGKGILKSVTIIGHLFIVNCWEDPCKSPTVTNWMNTLNSQSFCQ